MTPDQRYERDVEFRTLVDLLTQKISACRYTPTELREAVILAATRYEMMSTRSLRLDGPWGEDVSNMRSQSNRETLS